MEVNEFFYLIISIYFILHFFTFIYLLNKQKHLKYKLMHYDYFLIFHLTKNHLIYHWQYIFFQDLFQIYDLVNF